MQALLPFSPARCAGLVAGILLASCGAIACERAAYAGETPPPSTVDRARAAYDRGVRAHALRDHATAARAFAEADALAPQPASLEAALESALRADDPLLGAELVDRAEGRAGEPGVARSLEAARRRFAGRTGRIRVDCRGETRCVAAVDGSPTDARRPIYVTAGPHAVLVQRGDERQERLVEVMADATVVVAAPDRAGAGGPGTAGLDEEPRRGISPAWFVAGAGATAVFAGLTVLSGLDAVSKHDRFVSDGCSSGATGPRPAGCDGRGREGESAQLRTNLLLGATAALVATTIAVGVFAVRWKDGTRARVTVGTAGSAPSAAMAGFELVTP